WADTRSGDSDVYAQRLDSNGNRLWGDTGSPMSTVSGSIQITSRIVPDGKFGALVGWGDFRNTPTLGDQYVNRAFAPVGNVDVTPSAPPSSARLLLLSSQPARGAVQFRLDLPSRADVALEVVDATGRRVQTSGRVETLAAGSHALTWDGRDDAGADVRPGVYFVVVRAGNE